MHLSPGEGKFGEKRNKKAVSVSDGAALERGVMKLIIIET